MRPRAVDSNGLSYLIDTGAAVSCYPVSRVNRPISDPKVTLQAVNGSRIKTFGKRTFRFKFGTLSFTHNFVVSDIPQVVLGWDWLTKFQLDLRWHGSRCRLVRGSKGVNLKLAPASSDLLGLAQVGRPDGANFKAWLQVSKSSEIQQPDDIPPAYETLLARFPNIDKPNFKATPAHGVVHHINTADHPPCKAKVRKLLPGSQKEVMGKKKWLEMEALGVVTKLKVDEPIIWSSALHLVPKDGNDIRAVGDFRPLNSKTQQDYHPLPNLRSFQDRLKGATVFSKLDLKAGYYQVPLSHSASLKTITLTNWGPYRYLRMPMGLVNSGATFQRMMETVLQGLEGVFIYLDDLLVWAKDEAEHMVRVEAILSRLHANNLAIARSKCQFAKSSLSFLGYVVDQHGILPMKRKVEAITEFPPPTRTKALLGYLGAVNYYRRCLPNLGGESPAAILQPLYNLATSKVTGKSFKAQWDEDNLIENFNKSKLLLVMACKLTHPDPEAPLALVTDASKVACGASLEQLSPEGVWRPLGYWSRHLKPNQCAWTTYRRETFAVQQALRHFHEEIAGRPLTIYCDHLPLVQSFKSPNPPMHDQIAYNHLMEIAQWCSDLRHVSGWSNAVADWLSRPEGTLGAAHTLDPSMDPTVAAVDPPAPPPPANAFSTVDHVALATAQAQCPDIANYKDGKHKDHLKIELLEFIPGTRLWCEMSTGKARPIIPLPFRSLIFNAFHNLRHPGPRPTVKKVQERYFWPSLHKDVTTWAKECQPCQKVKVTKSIAPPTKNRPVGAARFSDLQLDCVGPSPAQKECHIY